MAYSKTVLIVSRCSHTVLSAPPIFFSQSPTFSPIISRFRAISSVVAFTHSVSLGMMLMAMVRFAPSSAAPSVARESPSASAAFASSVPITIPSLFASVIISRIIALPSFIIGIIFVPVRDP